MQIFTKIFHTHLGAGFRERLLGTFVPVVLWPEFVGYEQVSPRYSTLPEYFSQLYLKAVILRRVDEAYAAVSDCVQDSLLTESPNLRRALERCNLRFIMKSNHM